MCGIFATLQQTAVKLQNVRTFLIPVIRSLSPRLAGEKPALAAHLQSHNHLSVFYSAEGDFIKSRSDFIYALKISICESTISAKPKDSRNARILVNEAST